MCKSHKTQEMATSLKDDRIPCSFLATDDTRTTRKDLSFFAIGDTGHNCQEIRHVAAAMDRYAKEQGGIDFVLLLGDNFYPDGVTGVEDSRFKDTWADVFLCHPHLNVPWKVVLGNHDYMLNPDAQIQYTYRSDLNPTGLWQCPARNYKFSHIFGADSEPVQVDFFALDTNGVQNVVRRRFPKMQNELFDYVRDLDEQLKESSAPWKIVFGHHAMYTRGLGHGILGRCLRADSYSSRHGEAKGYNLEKVLCDGQVAAYFSGHDHRMQHHHSKGVHHFVCGASGAEASMLYQGTDQSQCIDWVDKGDELVGHHGFAAVSVTATEMMVRFVTDENEVIEEVQIPRPK